MCNDIIIWGILTPGPNQANHEAVFVFLCFLVFFCLSIVIPAFGTINVLWIAYAIIKLFFGFQSVPPLFP